MTNEPLFALWRGGHPRAESVHDLGMQHERTALAWDRTALALMVAGGALTHAGGTPYLDAQHAPAYLVVGFGAFLLFWAARRYQSREVSLRTDLPVVRPRLIRVVGAVTVLLSFSALVVVATDLAATLRS